MENNQSKIFISIVSHGHDDMIRESGILEQVKNHKNINLVIKNNKIHSSLNEKNSECIYSINEQFNCGFGENNNIVFNFCKSHLNMKGEDYFIVLNPDVLIDLTDVVELCHAMRQNDEKAATINLFKDDAKTIYDNSIRHFPKFKDFFLSYLGFKNKTIIEKSSINNKCIVDWAAGSFLAFRADHYAKLGGFDESFFMYCEDIDICYRSKVEGMDLVYYPMISAVHKAQHANRSLFSKHFVWHVKSIIKYCAKTKAFF
ncbi:glycosyltransferase family 2 protein [Leclercia adecarboxylata]|uniref:Glycosyltransferase family 2 protein n=1 Tax=Leclercia adecarboxylata TaxID=83655 RepID=A0AAP9D9G8_9ENTR|nr:glycosyltransferase family 2 protein [Leclercia adecarboxylata]QDK17132.1 glycosyltransferase family 2 protein [Leclercia adecarboxylata]